MSNILLNELYKNTIKTGIAVFILVIVMSLIRFIIARTVDTKQKRQKINARVFYVTICVLILVMARIWVEGFTHLLAVLGLVSAALVITNKETIMNVVGWLVITWRGLFSEDDLIQVNQYQGYVKSFGLLYFTLAEVSEGYNGHVTGRLIRIPNGQVATSALINLSQNHQLMERKCRLIVMMDCDIDYVTQKLTVLADTLIQDYYKGRKEFSMEHLSRKNKYLKSRLNLCSTANIDVKFDKPSGIEITLQYYCFLPDWQKLQAKLWKEIMSWVKVDNKICLSYT